MAKRNKPCDILTNGLRAGNNRISCHWIFNKSAFLKLWLLQQSLNY